MNYNSDFIEGLKKDGYEYYFEAYDQLPTTYDRIAETKQSTAAYEKGTVLSGPGTLDEKTYGGDYETVGLTETWTWVIKNREFGNLLPIEGSTVEDIKERAGDIVKEWAGEWGGASKRTKEVRIANLFNYGGYTAGHDATFDNSIAGGVVTDSSGDLIYDSKPFFNLSNNTRTAKNGSTYYNGLSLTLTATNFETAWTLLKRTNAKTESGDEMALPLETLGMLVANTSQVLTAKKIFLSEQVAGGNLNDKNVLMKLVSEDRIIEMPYFNDATVTAGAWAIGCLKKGIRFYDRVAPQFDFWEEKKSNTLYARIRMRCGAGVIQWRYWVGSNFPTS